MHSYGRHLERIEKSFNERVDGLVKQQRTLEQALQTAFEHLMPAAPSEGGGGGRGNGGGTVPEAGRQRLHNRLSQSWSQSNAPAQAPSARAPLVSMPDA